jgi:hypothetical protein
MYLYITSLGVKSELGGVGRAADEGGTLPLLCAWLSSSRVRASCRAELRTGVEWCRRCADCAEETPCIYVCMYVCMCVYMYVCIHVYMYMFTHLLLARRLRQRKRHSHARVRGPALITRLLGPWWLSLVPQLAALLAAAAITLGLRRLLCLQRLIVPKGCAARKDPLGHSASGRNSQKSVP